MTGFYPAFRGDLREYIREIERYHLALAMRDAQGCKAKAARALKINRTTLTMKLKSHGLFNLIPVSQH